MGPIILYSDFKPGVSDIVDHALVSLLTGKSCRVGYIPSDSDIKRRYVAKVADNFRKIGITDLFYFDLGEEFSDAKTPELFQCDMIYLSGGDPSRFLSLIHQRKFGGQLREYLLKGGIIAGVSAGAMILGNSLGLAHDFESPEHKKPTPALRVVDFEIYPHFKGDRKTSQHLERYARQRKKTVYGFDDNAGLVVQDGRVQTLGEVMIFQP